MIKIIRKKDLTDFFAVYKYYINNDEYILESGDTIITELKENSAYFQIKFLYFTSQKFLLSKDINTTIKIGSCMNNKMLLFMMPIIFFSFIFSFFTKIEFSIFFEISKYLSLFYFFVLIYFSTFGYKKYFQIELEYNNL